MTAQGAEKYRGGEKKHLFPSGRLCLSTWKTERVSTQLCQKHNSMKCLPCFSKYWFPLLQGSSVTWHSAYPRNLETVTSMLICLCFKELRLQFDFSHIISQINFQVPDWTENNWRPASLLVALPFFLLIPLSNDLACPQRWDLCSTHDLPGAYLILFIAVIHWLTPRPMFSMCG